MRDRRAGRRTRCRRTQIRISLAGLTEFRVDWQRVPAWRPAGIADSGREQHRAIGCSFS